jgi:hypothetical protein
VNQVVTDQAAVPTKIPMAAPPAQVDHDTIHRNMRNLPQDKRRVLLEQMLDYESF